MPTINKNKKIREKPTQYKHEGNQGSKYYNTKQWNNLRNRYIKEHPFCEMCLEEGKVKLAEQVHHKTEFLSGLTEEERWQLLTDEDNLQSLCSECHHKIHNEKRKNLNPPTS